MAKRPKESTFGIGAGLVSVYSAGKVRSMSNQLEKSVGALGKQNEYLAIQNSINSQKREVSEKIVLSNIKNIAELQSATMGGIYNLHQEVEELSKGQWALLNHFESVQAEKNKLGDLKIFLRNVKKEVEKIREMSEFHPVYATYMAENLRDMFVAKNVKIEHFKMLSVEEIDWADEIIQSVDNLYDTLFESLGE